MIALMQNIHPERFSFHDSLDHEWYSMRCNAADFLYCTLLDPVSVGSAIIACSILGTQTLG